ncbi:MAG: MFS transporter, partial [Candidatus Binatia bacterium]
VLGPAIGGLLGVYGARLPFWVAGACSLANALYGYFILPESLPRERRAGFRWRTANPIGALQLLRSHPQLLGLAAANFLGYIAHEVLPSTFVLFAGYRFAWDERAVGLFLAGVGLAGMVVSGGLVQPIVTWLGERRALLLGLTCGALAFAVYGLAQRGGLLWCAIPLQALWGVAGASAQQIMTRRVEPSAQGQLQGANSSLRGVAGLIGPGLFTLTFARAIDPSRASQMPGAPFVLASALVAGAVAVAWRSTRPHA